MESNEKQPSGIPNLLKLLTSIDGHHVVAFILAMSAMVSCQYPRVGRNGVQTDSRAALLLAGCASNASALSNVYLFAIGYSNGSQMSVRAGYFGLCANEGTASGTWACSSNGQGLKAKLGGTGQGDGSLDVIDMAARYKTGVVFPGLM